MNTRKSGSFLAVAGGMDFPFQKQLKGIDLIFEVSKYFPESLFTIVGMDSRQQTVDVGSNIKLIPPVANKDLPEIFSSHQFFFQLSMAEGFPNSLCEAMLCECIPIGSDVFSIPEIIGSTGYLLKKRDVLEALSQSNEEMCGHARRRIIDNYTLEKRKLKFIKLFNDLGIQFSAEY
jgi:glycosyltransferase involved in cell wall biosynthesis